MQDPQRLFNHCVDNEFSRSIKLTDVREIDAPLLQAYIRESIAVNKKGFKRTVADKTVVVPEPCSKPCLKTKRPKRFSIT